MILFEVIFSLQNYKHNNKHLVPVDLDFQIRIKRQWRHSERFKSIRSVSLDVLFISSLVRADSTTLSHHLWYAAFCVVIYHPVSNLQGHYRLWRRSSVWQSMMRHASLPWWHLRQFMRGSLRGGASQIQQTSSTPAATEGNRKTEGRGRCTCERKTETHRERKQSTALIYVYWFTSLPPHWFQSRLHLWFDALMFSLVLTSVETPLWLNMRWERTVLSLKAHLSNNFINWL